MPTFKHIQKSLTWVIAVNFIRVTITQRFRIASAISVNVDLFDLGRVLRHRWSTFGYVPFSWPRIWMDMIDKYQRMQDTPWDWLHHPTSGHSVWAHRGLRDSRGVLILRWAMVADPSYTRLLGHRWCTSQARSEQDYYILSCFPCPTAQSASHGIQWCPRSSDPIGERTSAKSMSKLDQCLPDFAPQTSSNLNMTGVGQPLSLVKSCQPPPKIKTKASLQTYADYLRTPTYSSWRYASCFVFPCFSFFKAIIIHCHFQTKQNICTKPISLNSPITQAQPTYCIPGPRHVGVQARKPSFLRMFSSALRTAAQGLELPETSKTSFLARSKSFLKPETWMMRS